MAMSPLETLPEGEPSGTSSHNAGSPRPAAPPSYRPVSASYPPTQPAPLFLDDEDDTDPFRARLCVHPDHRLRLTRTPTEAIHEVISEDDRRREAKRERLGRKRKFTLSRKGAGDGSVFSTLKSPTRKGTTKSGFREGGSDLSELGRKQGVVPPPMPRVPEPEPDDEHTANMRELEDSPAADQKAKVGKGEKRAVYVNVEMPLGQLDSKGRPKSSYPRNKVRTTKYTILTFFPKNLTEQFRNVANIYFLFLILLQIFPIFGAASPALAALPLLFIVAVTALKDAVEDYRRYTIDNSVNNSPCTRLSDWRNVNVPIGGGGSWWDNLYWPWEGDAVVVDQIGQRKKLTKGIRKLREREKETFNTDFLYTSQSASNTANASDALSEIDDLDVPSIHRARSSSTSTVANSLRGRGQTRPSELIDYTQPTPGTARWERTLWKKLEVGDIVLLREDEAIPADLIILSSSDPEGQCFVETKNLDGETNLKPRRAVKATRGIADEEDLEHAHFVIDSEAPHANLYAYSATLRWWTKDENIGQEHPITEGRVLKKGQEQKEAIGINELLLRGCTIRNTQWILGLVMFTGKDTKIMLNQGDTPSKRPKIAHETNYNVIVNFVVLAAICLVNAIGDGIYQAADDSSGFWFEQDSQPANNNFLNGAVTLGVALILYQSIVPISLVITLELVRSIQAAFIVSDIDMYYEPLDHPAVPKSWNLSDDLGQIQYIFSDKTGTLTQNVMEFQKCSVNGIAYGEGITEAMLGAAKREGRDTSALDPTLNAASLEGAKARMIEGMRRLFKHRYLHEEALTLISPKMVDDLSDTRSAQRQRLIEFWRALALCHDVLASKDEHDPFSIEYKAESPDEAALVSAARDAGFVFVSRTHAELEIEVLGQTERYIPLRMLEFNSSRKRMSILVRCPDGRVRLYCKGADSIIMARLSPDQDPVLKAETERNLTEFANAGLRTLLISVREVSEEEVAQFMIAHDAASQSSNREDEMEKVADGIERGLRILGATALEDKLQVGVPDAIEQLHRAGLKLWVLTGDKLQTAIEIGFSCNLLQTGMDMMIISSDTEAGARSQIEQGLDKIMAATAGHAAKPAAGFAVVIDGETLRFALDGSLKAQFLQLTVQCETVVCCRVSPAQKALTVKLVKDGCGAMTLAIGDGANDVAMIQEANIGVGIAGLEGAQASMSADYAIGQFRFLTKLLLVHGRWCYLRVADMHSGFFFKNGVFTFSLFWFQLYCSFNGTYLFDYSIITLFNLIFTSLPVAMLGIFEQDVTAKQSMAYPSLYRHGSASAQYTRVSFWACMLDSVYQSAVAFWIPYFIYFSTPSVSITGHDASIWEFGTTVAVGAVIVANNFIALQTRYWTWIIITVQAVSSLSVVVWILVYSQIKGTLFENVAQHIYTTLEFWASVVLVQVLSLMPRYVFEYWRIQERPREGDLVRELVLCGERGRRDAEIESAHSPRPLARTASWRSDRAQRLSRLSPISTHQVEAVEMMTAHSASLPTIHVSETASVGTAAPDVDPDHGVQAMPYRPYRERISTTSSIASADSLKQLTESPPLGSAYSPGWAYGQGPSASRFRMQDPSDGQGMAMSPSSPGRHIQDLSEASSWATAEDHAR